VDTEQAVPSRLRAGHGAAACGLLVGLADAALKAENFRFKPRDTAAEVAGEVSDATADGGFAFDGGDFGDAAGEIGEAAGDPLLRLANGTCAIGVDDVKRGGMSFKVARSDSDEGHGGEGDRGEEEVAGMEAGKQAAAWRAEAARLDKAGRLRLPALQLGSGWRVTAESFARRLPGVTGPLAQAEPLLASMVGEQQVQLDGIQATERLLQGNGKLQPLQAELLKLSARLAEQQQHYASVDGPATRLAAASSELQVRLLRKPTNQSTSVPCGNRVRASAAPGDQTRCTNRRMLLAGAHGSGLSGQEQT
jgi:hypothetical protein